MEKRVDDKALAMRAEVIADAEAIQKHTDDTFLLTFAFSFAMLIAL